MDATRTQGSRFFFSDVIAAAGILAALVFGVFLLMNTREQAMVVNGALFAGFGTAGLLMMVIRLRSLWPQHTYNDAVTIGFAVMALFWGLAGFFLGDILVWLGDRQVLAPDFPWTAHGRPSPLHSSAVYFASGGNVLFAVSFYAVQRTCQTRLSGLWAPWFVFWGFQLLIAMAGASYVSGVSAGREYAEPEWYSDVWLTILWAATLAIVTGTIIRRTSGYLAVLNLPFLLIFVMIGVLHIGNNMTVPASFAGSKSYIVYAGVQDAMTQWWYSHKWPWR